jgi:hypothetical protein
MTEVETNIADDGEAPLPVLKVDAGEAPAVMAYANLRGALPPDSRFICQRHADGGMTHTEPPDPRSSLGTRAGGALLMLLALTWLCFLVYDSIRTGGWSGIMAAPLILGTLGHLLWFEGRCAAHQPLVIEARPGELTVDCRTMLSVTRRRSFRGRRLGKITVPPGTPSLPSMRLYSGVYITPRFSLAVPIVTGRPKDECEWIAKILREATLSS